MKQPKDHIVFPLDVPTRDEALHFVKTLKGHIGVFKIGLELFISEGPSIVDAVREAGAEEKIFLDLKLHDIPATVQRALRALLVHRPDFVTVHCDQGGGFLKEIEGGPGHLDLLGVTLLTSMNRQSLQKSGFAKEYVEDLPRMVLMRARMAKDAGCRGVVCSGHEAGLVKKELGENFLVVTPGIRPLWSLVEKDDQKRIVTPADAVGNGADYLVIGRPIRSAEAPADAADRIGEEIASAL